MTMCIVIDINVFGSVFGSTNSNHDDYAPVQAWVTEREGFVVMGGSQYLSELKKSKQYYGVLIELSKKGRVIIVSTEVVDQQQVQVEKLLATSDCDDCHLIAIIRASGCRLICSNDRRADKHLKNPDCYPGRQKPPSIYRSKHHKHLLRQENIVRIRNAK